MDTDLHRVFLLVLLSLSIHLVSADLREKSSFFVDNQRNWGSAQSYCSSHHGGPLIIRSQLSDSLSDGEGWIGLKQVGDIWTWINAGSLNYSNWKDNEPPDKPCVLWKSDGWKGESCDAEKSSYCFSKNLILIDEEKTWEQANRHCRGLNPSKPYGLVTLATPDDHLFAFEQAQGATTAEVWTGLRYLAHRWFWVSDRDQEVPASLPVCPRQDNFCSAVSRESEGLRTRNCMERKNFFCQRVYV